MKIDSRLFTYLITLTILLLTMHTSLNAETDTTVRELDFPLICSDISSTLRTPVNGDYPPNRFYPAVFESHNEVVSFFPSIPKKEFDQLNVAFESDDLIIFAWIGSGGDRANLTIIPETRAFEYGIARGLTRDLAFHCFIATMPKDFNLIHKP